MISRVDGFSSRAKAGLPSATFASSDSISGRSLRRVPAQTASELFPSLFAPRAAPANWLFLQSPLAIAVFRVLNGPQIAR